MTTRNHIFFGNFSAIKLSSIERTHYLLIGIWTLAMIALPIAIWTLGDAIIPQAVTFALSLEFLAVMHILGRTWGWRRTFSVFLIVTALTWNIEYIGAKFSFPFGDYQYTDALTPHFMGVPLLVPLAWFMMLPPSWAVARCIVGNMPPSHYRGVVFILMSGLAMMAWDLFLDPQMVNWGFWQWDSQTDLPLGTYFGIPWANYAGWLLTAIILTAILRPDRAELPITPLLLIYGITWFLETFGLAFFWGQIGPAIVGGVVMGGFLLLATHYHLKASK